MVADILETLAKRPCAGVGERAREAAPTYVFRKDPLLFFGRRAPLGDELLGKAYGFDVVDGFDAKGTVFG